MTKKKLLNDIDKIKQELINFDVMSLINITPWWNILNDKVRIDIECYLKKDIEIKDLTYEIEIEIQYKYNSYDIEFIYP